MPDDEQDGGTVKRHTGAAATFLNTAALAVQRQVTAANHARSTALADAHQQAQNTVDAAQQKAAQVLSQNLKKLYLCVDNFAKETRRWIEVDANDLVDKHPLPFGYSVVNDSLPFGYDAVFDEANQRVFYSVERPFLVPNTSSVPDPWGFPGQVAKWARSLMSARHPAPGGGDPNVLFTGDSFFSASKKHFLRNPFSALALDESEGALFFYDGDGTVYRTDISGPSTSPLIRLGRMKSWFPLIALDTRREIIYHASPSGGMGILYLYRSNPNARVDEIRLFSPSELANPVTFMAVDSEREHLYWQSSGRLFRGALSPFRELRERGSRVMSLDVERFKSSAESFAIPGPVALDIPNQWLYTLDQESNKLRVGPIGGRTYLKEGFPSFTLNPGEERVSRLCIVTKSDEAAQRLASSKFQLDHAPLAAAQILAQAHQDAATKRQQAHSELEDAHTKAANDITAAQQKAAQVRKAAQDEAQVTHANAEQNIREAKLHGDQRWQEAKNEAQGILDDRRRKADVDKQTAQATLDAERRRLQNS